MDPLIAQQPPTSLGAEERTWQFELVKLDYARLGNQEQSLMDKRSEIWPKFIAIIIIPSGYAGIVGLNGSLFLLSLIPFFLACIALDMKHDEQVLRYDVRKNMKNLAAQWGFANHDSQYSHQDGSRWWAGYYKYGKAVAFLAVELIASVLVGWSFFSTKQLLIGGVLATLNSFFVVFTGWCLV